MFVENGVPEGDVVSEVVGIDEMGNRVITGEAIGVLLQDGAISREIKRTAEYEFLPAYGRGLVAVVPGGDRPGGIKSKKAGLCRYRVTFPTVAAGFEYIIRPEEEYRIYGDYEGQISVGSGVVAECAPGGRADQLPILHLKLVNFIAGERDLR